MIALLRKHAGQTIDFASDFVDQLGSGDSLGSPAVRVMKGTGTEFDPESGRFRPVGPWSDVTAQFVSLAAEVEEGTSKVHYRMKARAASTEQVAGLYHVICECTTGESESLVDQFDLEVTDDGLA